MRLIAAGFGVWLLIGLGYAAGATREQLAANHLPVDTLVTLEGSSGCFRYLGWANAHIIQNLDTGGLKGVYISKITQVSACGKSLGE